MPGLGWHLDQFDRERCRADVTSPVVTIAENRNILVVDDFVSNPDEIRASALLTGFGTWHPKNTVIGYKNYDGVNINGMHVPLLRSLTRLIGQPIFPASMIFRVTGAESDASRVHSDRTLGSYSCIVYLSRETEPSGTAFYRHRATGSYDQPPLGEMLKDPAAFEQLKREMDEASDEVWEQVYFCEGTYARALVFPAPLYHSRVPQVCQGTTPEDSRMAWVCHFEI